MRVAITIRKGRWGWILETSNGDARYLTPLEVWVWVALRGAV